MSGHRRVDHTAGKLTSPASSRHVRLEQRSMTAGPKWCAAKVASVAARGRRQSDGAVVGGPRAPHASRPSFDQRSKTSQAYGGTTPRHEGRGAPATPVTPRTASASGRPPTEAEALTWWPDWRRSSSTRWSCLTPILLVGFEARGASGAPVRGRRVLNEGSCAVLPVCALLGDAFTGLGGAACSLAPGPGSRRSALGPPWGATDFARQLVQSRPPGQSPPTASTSSPSPGGTHVAIRRS